MTKISTRFNYHFNDLLATMLFGLAWISSTHE